MHTYEYIIAYVICTWEPITRPWASTITIFVLPLYSIHIIYITFIISAGFIWLYIYFHSLYCKSLRNDSYNLSLQPECLPQCLAKRKNKYLSNGWMNKSFFGSLNRHLLNFTYNKIFYKILTLWESLKLKQKTSFPVHILYSEYLNAPALIKGKTVIGRFTGANKVLLSRTTQ